MSNIDLINIEEVVNEALSCEISSGSRKRVSVDGKKIFCYISKQLTEKTLKEIGEHINLTHATILYHIRTFENLMRYDQKLRDATKFCMLVCNNMLGNETLKFRDNVELYWKTLSFKQQETLSRLAKRYYINNTKINEYEKL